MGKILDMSHYRSVSDWDALAAELDFCILRSSIGMEADEKYADHAKQCADRNIPMHAYHYMKATSPSAAILEAFAFWQAASPFAPLSYVIDVEWDELPTDQVAAITRQFILELRRLGVERVGLYIAHHMYDDYRIDVSLADWIWIPRYGKNDGEIPEDKYLPKHPCDLWQYTSEGRIAGVGKEVDLNKLTGTKPLRFFTEKTKEENDMPEEIKKTVRVGSARSSYGNTSYGDQNDGKEVSTENWYLHGKGWVLLRAKDAAAREKIAVAMEHACDNNDIGYSQGTRNTLRDNVKGKGYDPAKTSKKVNCDCSSLVRVCCNYAGIMVGDFTTDKQASKMMGTGAFVKYTDDAHCKAPDRLLRGDVLVTKTKGHTVVVLDDGALAAQEAEYAPVGADKSEAAPVFEAAVIVTGGSVNLRTGPGTQYDKVAVVRKGDVLEGVSGWIPVIVDGEVRWISGKYAKLEV